MKTFKKGDVVEVAAKDAGLSHRNGTIGIITESHTTYANIQIFSASPEFESSVRMFGADGWGFFNKHLKFITHAEGAE